MKPVAPPGRQCRNGHTIAALVMDQRIEGLYEHHTHELTPEKLERDLRRFIRGELRSQEVFEGNGHGLSI